MHDPVVYRNTSAQLSHDFANIGSLESAVRSGILDADHVARHPAILRRDDCLRND
jgi:hypothetical protein